jgi:DNA-binding NarL/FixJ family response regulator
VNAGCGDRSQETDRLGLTYREEEVIDLVAAGRSNKQIARQLHISESTVKHHITHILEKLNAQNRAAAAVEWVRRVAE